MKKIIIVLITLFILFFGGCFGFQKYTENQKQIFNEDYIESVKKRVVNANTIEDKIDILKDEQTYVNRPPQNKKLYPQTIEHINQQLLETKNWSKAKNINTDESYKSYLAEHPNGIYSNEAEAKEKELLRIALEEKTQLLKEEKRKSKRAKLVNVTTVVTPKKVSSSLVPKKMLSLKKLVCNTQQERNVALFKRNYDKINILINGEQLITEHQMKAGDIKILSNSEIPRLTLSSSSDHTIKVMEKDEGDDDTLFDLSFVGNDYSLGVHQKKWKGLIGEYTLVYEIVEIR